jgi:hypothetical protein
MKKNTETILAFLLVILIFVLLGSFLLSRLDFYKPSEIPQTDDRIPSNMSSLSQEQQEDKKRSEYISRHLHRGYFENYDRSTGKIAIQAETRIGTQVSTEIKQFKITQNQEVLCWPLTVPGIDSPWDTAYIALEQNGYLYLNDQQKRSLSQISSNLSNKNYVFIHELGGVIQEIAIAGCKN